MAADTKMVALFAEEAELEALPEHEVTAAVSTRLAIVQKICTALQHDGPNHLGLWLIR